MESEELAGRENKLSRKQILEKKKAINEIMKAVSSSHQDHLSYFPDFRHYKTNGVSVHLESRRGDKLSSSLKQYIQNLLKVNMESAYGSEWPIEEKVKRKEMVSAEAQYIFVQEDTTEKIEMEKASTHSVNSKGSFVGFVHYRFVIEEEIPVLYVYELQLEACVRRKGIGDFLMELIELIAQKNQMGAVVLTVQKANLPAIDFYIRKLSYRISSISPSRVDQLVRVCEDNSLHSIGLGKSYAILCKTFNHEAKTVFEIDAPT